MQCFFSYSSKSTTLTMLKPQSCLASQTFAYQHNVAIKRPITACCFGTTCESGNCENPKDISCSERLIFSLNDKKTLHESAYTQTCGQPVRMQLTESRQLWPALGAKDQLTRKQNVLG